MARKRRPNTAKLWGDFARLIIVLGFLAYAPIAAWWNSIPSGGRTFMIVMASVTIVSGMALVIVLAVYRKRERAKAWKRAMAGWENVTHGTLIAQKQSAMYMSDIELEKLAAQVYRKMGYHVESVGAMGDHGVDVLLINPNNEKEIVQCKQWYKLVGEPVVRDLYGAMAHEKAVRGWLWAPRGVSEPARTWAKGKKIELLDERDIGRLIESAFGNVT